MAISLEKGQRIDLTKGKAGLSKLMVGLGWDQCPQAEDSSANCLAEAVRISTVTLQC